MKNDGEIVFTTNHQKAVDFLLYNEK